MRLTVNGEIVENSNAGTIMELLHEFQINPGQVAVEVNLSIIKKADYSTFRLNDGDNVEIVNFVGGGCEYNGRGLPCRSFSTCGILFHRSPRFLPLYF